MGRGGARIKKGNDMGIVVEKTIGIETVGELIEALRKFPADMPIDVEMDRSVVVFRVKPQPGEDVPDKRGYVCICGGDSEDW